MKIKNILLLSLFLSGCNAEKQLAKISVKNPELLAKTCGNFFPVKESTTKETIYVQGQKDTIWQSEYIDCDTIIGKDRILRIPYLVKIRDTFKVIEIRTEENTAKVKAFEVELFQTKWQLLSTQQTLKNTRGFVAVLISILATIGIFLYIKSRLK